VHERRPPCARPFEVVLAERAAVRDVLVRVEENAAGSTLRSPNLSNSGPATAVVASRPRRRSMAACGACRCPPPRARELARQRAAREPERDAPACAEDEAQARRGQRQPPRADAGDRRGTDVERDVGPRDPYGALVRGDVTAERACDAQCDERRQRGAERERALHHDRWHRLEQHERQHVGRQRDERRRRQHRRDDRHAGEAG
jgi:hypothetical protein